MYLVLVWGLLYLGFGWFCAGCLFNKACLMAELYLQESKSISLMEAKI